MNNVRLPIKTVREGNKITKICVEDSYKLMNRVLDTMDRAYNKSLEIINSVDKEYEGVNGSLIIGKGVSQPCFTDAFDEEIGNNIAFMKAKLNANIKKNNIMSRIIRVYDEALDSLMFERIKIEDNIYRDIDGVRKHNPEYLIDKY